MIAQDITLTITPRHNKLKNDSKKYQWINNGNWTEWSAIWSEIIRVISARIRLKSQVWFQTKTARHEVQLPSHFITSILKSQNLVSTNILLIK